MANKNVKKKGEKVTSEKGKIADTAHDFYLYEREDGRLVWKCLYCGVEVETFEEACFFEDEPCEAKTRNL